MVLEGRNISFGYDNSKLLFNNFNIQIKTGEKVCIFAKSGYGKSTLAKILSGYETPSTGGVYIDNKEVTWTGFSPIQLVFQHPEKAVNPKWRIKDILEETGEIDYNILEKLHIDGDFLHKYPTEMSGGELQRICIARSLKKETKFLIADEITSMLDAITQANIWNVMLEESKDKGLIMITHNRFLAERIADRILDLEKEN